MARAGIEMRVGKPSWSRDGRVWLCSVYSLPDRITLNAQFHQPTGRALFTISQDSDSAWYARYSESGHRFLQESVASFAGIYKDEPEQTGSFDRIRAIFGQEDLFRRCW